MQALETGYTASSRDADLVGTGTLWLLKRILNELLEG
jgi:hypothetical protein